MESCTGQWLPGFPLCGICTFLPTLDAKYILWIFLSWTSFEEKLPQCVVGFELNQDVVFLKICPFLRSSEIVAVGGDASVIVDVPLFILEQFEAYVLESKQTVLLLTFVFVFVQIWMRGKASLKELPEAQLSAARHRGEFAVISW